MTTTTTTTYGTLFGVGVGPGAPDLVTLRAIDVMRKADVLALPRSTDFGDSVAWSIVKSHLAGVEGQERLVFTFPMSKDPAKVKPCWDKAFEAIGERLSRGLSVAFVTEGDPSLFSTFVYLQREAPRRWPGVRVEVVPGVTSVTAVPAMAGIPLADGQERIAILPATYGIDDLRDVLTKFDTVVLMKLGGEMPKVIAALEERDLLHRAVYVSRATMGAQRVVRDLREVSTEHGDCFAMVVVTKRERSGLLMGGGQ